MVATLNGMEMNRRPYILTDFNEVSFGIGGKIGTTTVGPRFDYVEVVPEPVTFAGFGAAVGLLLRRKKK